MAASVAATVMTLIIQEEWVMAVEGRKKRWIDEDVLRWTARALEMDIGLVIRMKGSGWQVKRERGRRGREGRGEGEGEKRQVL